MGASGRKEPPKARKPLRHADPSRGPSVSEWDDSDRADVRQRRSGRVVDAAGQLLQLDHGCAPLCGHSDFGLQAVPGPAQSGRGIVDSVVSQRCCERVSEGWIDAVHQPAANVFYGSPEENGDRGGDEQPDDRVSEGQPEPDAEHAGDDGQGSEPVGAGVDAVRDQRGRADLPPDMDSVNRYELVPGKADKPCGQDPAQILYWLGLEETSERFDRCDHGRECNHRDDEEPGEVLRAAEPIRVGFGRRSAAKYECDPERHGRQGVREVMNGVGQQRDRTADQDNDKLEQGRQSQSYQRDLHCPDSLGAGLQRGIHRVSCIVGVRDQQIPRPSEEPSVAVPAVVVMMMGAGWMFVMPVAMRVGGRLAHCPAASLPECGRRWW